MAEAGLGAGGLWNLLVGLFLFLCGFAAEMLQAVANTLH